MRLEWTQAARGDLARIWSFHAARDADRAAAIEDRIVDRAVGLLATPRPGRPGKVAGTRELLIADIGYLLVFEELVDAIRIVRVWSTAEQR